MITPITLIKGDKNGSDTDYRDYLPVNMYGVQKPVLGAAGYMLQAPGLTQYGNGVSVDRGGIWNDRLKDHYRVSGTSLISVDSAGVSTVLGTIAGADTVSLPYSFDTQGIVANGRFYLYSPSGGFSEVTDPELGNPIDCVWVDGYYFFTDGEFIYHTDLGNESSIDPLKYATAEFMPDDSLGVDKTSDNKVMVFGRYTIEYFVNDASDNFSFVRVQSRALKTGIVGTHCKTEIKGQHFILGGSKEEHISIHSVSVGRVVSIASREVDKVISQYTEDQLSTSVLESIEIDGVSLLVVHLPNECLVCNISLLSSQGSELSWSIFVSDVNRMPWRAKHILFEPRKGKFVSGDKSGSALAVIDNSTALHFGAIAEWELYTPYIYLEDQSIDKLEIETIPGFNDAGDATVFVSLTYDGVTHGQEWTQIYGTPNAYGSRFILYRLGYVNSWFAFKLRGASRSRMAFGRGYIEHG